MKMKPEHYQHVEAEIRKTERRFGPEYLAEYRKRLEADSRVKDVPMRYRWDLFSGAGLDRYACDVLYTYLDDAHIDTALRRIVPS